MMRYKIRRVCIWVISVQIFLIILHIKIYQTFIGSYSIPTEENDSYLFTSGRKDETKQTTGNRKLFTENRNVKNASGNRLTQGIIAERLTTTLVINKVKNNRSQRQTKKVIFLVRKCSHIDFPWHLEDGDNWQAVDNKTAFVFASYYMEKTRSVIIIGARSGRRKEYYCLLWQENHGKFTAEQVDAEVKQLPEGHNLRYV